jgi:hypothetical protein
MTISDAHDFMANPNKLEVRAQAPPSQGHDVTEHQGL